MAKHCPCGSVLAAYAAGEGIDSRDAAHITACVDCRQIMALGEQMLTDGVNDDALHVAAKAVELLVAELLVVPEADRADVATSDTRFVSVAVARRFSDLATEFWESDLNAALTHSHVATSIAGVLRQRSADVAELEFEAWKNRSTIHRERGEFGAARASLMRAGAAADRCAADREMKAAVLWYAEACLCQSRDLWAPEEALALLDRCEPVFARRASDQWRNARTVRGIVYLHGGRYAEALDEFTLVERLTPRMQKASVADAQRNIANVLIRLERPEEARAMLARVRRTDVAVGGRALAVIRDDALLAEAARVAGEYDVAAEGFADVRRRFVAAGDAESALIAAKDRAMTLVALGDIDAASVELRGALASIVGNTDRALYFADALSYLRTLAERRELTLDIAAAVGKYVDEIHVQRARPFVPPMSPMTM